MADAPSLEQFTADAEAFVSSHCEKRSDDENKPFKWGEGRDNMSLFDEKDPAAEKRQVEEAKAWRQAKWAAGFGWITGPTEYGGAGLGTAYERAYGAVESGYRTPDQGPFGIGLGMVAPTILAHAQDHVKAKYLPQMWGGEIIGCQLFSEPGAGSDLASLQCKAEKDGDEWILTGQKVWTSGAQYSDIGEIICRTHPHLPKHKGLTGFVVDMKAPGVEVRPLRQMTGGASFNEVFFEEVRVPDDHRLGDETQGWAVALTTLMNERASIGAGSGGGAGASMTTRLAGMLEFVGKADDKVFRDKLAQLHIQSKVASYTNRRAMDKIRAGQTPGPEMSIAKMALTKNMMDTADFVSSALGPRMMADTGEWGTFSWAGYVAGVPGMRIAGGSDEVLRNIVGERVLGLPKEPGIDTTSAFKDLQVGTQR